MRRLSEERPPRVLMSCDAVGGVWRYAVDLAAALEGEGIETVLAVCGPPPSLQQRMEVSASRLVELDAPLDWMSESEDEVARVPRLLDELAADLDVDLVQVNLPSQAAGLKTSLPVVAVTHSCCVTWFAAVRGQPVPPGWQWHERLNRRGFERADAIVAPSGSHAALTRSSYGNLPAFCVIPNGSGVITGADSSKDRCVFAAGRWWDDGKNAEVLDRAAHPYTRGLLDAIPRVDEDQDALRAIPGNPPNMTGMPQGCPFAPRCESVMEACWSMAPELVNFAPGRTRACFRPVEEIVA